MKILHLSTPGSWRGGEQQLAYLLEEFAAYDDLQQYLLCAAGGELHKRCHKPGIRSYGVGPGWFYQLRYVARLRSLILKLGVDLVHAHDARAHSLALLALVALPRPPHLVVARRVDFPVRSSWISQRKYTSPRVSRILCVSRCVEAVLRASVAGLTNTAVVHSGIDIARFQQPAIGEDLRRRFELAPNTKLVAQVAALTPQKDYPTFVNCVEAMLRARSDLFFLIVGSGELEVWLRTRLAASPARARVALLGFRSDLPAIFAQLDLLLMSSQTEGLGTTVLDAFAARVPVAATRAGGIGEMVRHEQTGLLADVGAAEQLAQAGLRLLADPDLARSLSAAAYELLVQEFSKATTARKTYQHYLELVGGAASLHS